MKNSYFLVIGLIASFATLHVEAVAEEAGGFGSYLSAREKNPATSKAAEVKSEEKADAKAEKKSKKKKKNKVAAQIESREEAAPKRELASTPVAAPAQPAREIASDAATSPFRFGAFADFRFSRFSEHNDPIVPNANAESGFGLEDAAVYANYDKNRFSAVLDIAFRRGKEVDVVPGATIPNQSTNGNFSLGLDKSQLYVRYTAAPGLIVNFGQFDTIFGAELNDSKDRIFGKTGLVSDNTVPVTHAGAMLEYSTHGAYAKALAANPNNKGSLGSSTAGDDRTEYGGAIGYANEFIRGQAGILSRPINNASNVGRGKRQLMDFILGTTLGRFSLDLEHSRVTDANKNSLTPANNRDKEAAGTGFLALASYKITDDLLLGARYEEIKRDPNPVAASTVRRGKSTGGAIHYQLTPELQLRSEFISYKFKSEANVPWNASRFNVAALVKF